MASGTLNVALSGLNAAQIGLQTTSHNISNASTPGYSRQQIVQTTNTPMYTGSGYIGQGTNVSTVTRLYSQYLTGQLLTAQTGAAAMTSYQSQIEQIDNMLADSSTGLSPAMADFFKGVAAVAANPSDTASRQSMLSTGQEVTGQLQSLNQQLQQIRDGVNSQITTEVGTINAYAKQIAQINQQIIQAQAAAGSSQPPNDLLDQRDQLVASLNKEISATTVTQADGTYSVFIGNGEPLVLGTTSFNMVASPSPADSDRTVVSLQAQSGALVAIPESQLTGGTLGGLIAFRSQSLDSAQNGVGRIALALAQNANDIEALGQDLNGNLGTKLFNVPAPTVNASSLNTGTGTVSASIVDRNYRVVFAAAGNFVVYDANAGTALAAGIAAGGTTNVYVDGVKLTITNGNTAVKGDAFDINPGNPAGSRAIAESTNTGAATMDSSGSNIQALTTSDYQLDYLSNVAGNYTFRLTRLSDGTSWTGTGANYQTALDALAIQQQTGVTLTAPAAGTLNVGDSFTILPTRNAAGGISVAVTDPSVIAAAAPFATSTGLSNAGKASISAGAVINTSSLPLPGQVTFTYDAAAKTLTTPAGAAPWGNLTIPYDPATQSGAALTVNGLSFAVTGSPANGDTFTLAPNTDGVSDNRTAQRFAALQTTNTLAGMPGSLTAGATATYQSAYAQIVSEVGNMTNQVQATAKAQQSLATQAQTSRDSLSGVNLDEEAANLLQYQQAYQASAKVLAVVGKLFDQILALGA